MHLQLPIPLVRATTNRRGAEGKSWLEGLPTLTKALLETYNLTMDGQPYESTSNLAVPVVTKDGRKCVLKINSNDREFSLEIAALRHWIDSGAVAQIQAWDIPARAMLLNRAVPGTTFDKLPETQENLQRLANSMKAMWAVPAPGVSSFPTLNEHLRQRMILLRARIRSGVTDGVVTESDWKMAIDNAQKLFQMRPAPKAVVLHTDLYARNIIDNGNKLLIIDPKPCIGDPAFDAAMWAVKHEHGAYLKRNVSAIATLCSIHPLHVLAWARVIALDEIVTSMNHGTASRETCLALAPFIRGGATPDA